MLKLMNKVEECANEIPEETRVIIAALDNPIRQAILVLLSERKELFFLRHAKGVPHRKAYVKFPSKETILQRFSRPLL